jgi:YbbR domain-containing protein
MNWLQRLFTENIGLKLLALLLAVVVWTAVGGDVATEIVVPVPVEFRNVPVGVHYEADPARVELRVRGPRWMVRQALVTDFSVPVDLSKMAPGEQVVPLRRQSVSAPSSVEVIDISPPQLKLTVKAPGEP